MLGLRGSSWFAAWVGLELRILSFIPIILIRLNSQSEARIQYFLIQSLSSLIFIQSRVFISSLNLRFKYLIIVRLLLKLGVSPLHFWVPRVSSGLRWTINFILFTAQKLIPLTLLFVLIKIVRFYWVVALSLISLFFGSTGGIGEIDLRSLIAYSSIRHLRWLLVSMLIGLKLLLIYFSLYSIILVRVILELKINNFINLKDVFVKNSQKKINYLCLLFLSLGGVPPTLGFLPKWVVLSAISYQGLTIIGLSLLALSILPLFFYLRTRLFRVMLHSRSNFYFNTKKRERPLTLFLVRFNLLGLFYLQIFRGLFRLL